MKVQTCFIIILIYIPWNLEIFRLGLTKILLVLLSNQDDMKVWLLNLNQFSICIWHQVSIFLSPFSKSPLEQFSLKIATWCLDYCYLHTFSWHGICSGWQALSSNRSAYRSTESSTCWTSMSYSTRTSVLKIKSTFKTFIVASYF